MFYIYTQVYLSPGPASGKWVQFSKLNPQSNGTVTASYPDGTVLSIQPNGDWDKRPEGANGVYEQATLQGNAIVFNPTADFNGVYPFPLFESKVG